MGSTLLKNIYYKNNMNLVITSPLILILLSTPLLAYGLTCPDGTYIGRDNGGQEACRDIETNNIVDPKTGMQYDPHSGSPVVKGEEIDSTRAVIVGIVIIVIIIFVIKALTGGRQKTETPHNRQMTLQEKLYASYETAKIKQEGKCVMCKRMPNQWKFKTEINIETGKIICNGFCSDCLPDDFLCYSK